MPSRLTARIRYRKARCCNNCLHEDRRYCTKHCMPVIPECVCDEHEDDPKRASSEVKCSKCAFGPKGDRTCEIGRSNPKGQKSCFAGRELSQ